jgi:glycosyltransferase involved in cell wall biosynthesis
MFCSTVIPTIGRESLSSTVNSVLDQDFHAADHEVIVVNDSGKPLNSADWQFDERVRIINTYCRERSVARDVGAAIAAGEYLHFLDDDDLLLPEALKAFWQLRKENANAAWLYGSYQTVDNDGNLIEEFHPNLTGNIFAWLVAGESIPLQASLLQTDIFFKAGTFDPNLTYGEDRDLGRRFSLLGDVSWTPAVVTSIRVGQSGSSSDWSKMSEADRWGREKVLRLDGTVGTLKGLADSTYLQGRLCRALFGSARLNMREGSDLIAISRVLDGISIAGMNILSPSFWSIVRTKME